MCSIAGVIGHADTGVARAVVADMNRCQSHRGPDGSGIAVCGPTAVLGHRRLAIIDPHGGRQPVSADEG